MLTPTFTDEQLFSIWTSGMPIIIFNTEPVLKVTMTLNRRPRRPHQNPHIFTTIHKLAPGARLLPLSMN